MTIRNRLDILSPYIHIPKHITLYYKFYYTFTQHMLILLRSISFPLTLSHYLSPTLYYAIIFARWAQAYQKNIPHDFYKSKEYHLNR